ncbi:YdcF family protein [Nocardiopsis coralliicola]
MRTTDDGSGPQRGAGRSHAADDDGRTRVFGPSDRTGSAPADGGADATRVFTRPAGGGRGDSGYGDPDSAPFDDLDDLDDLDPDPPRRPPRRGPRPAPPRRRRPRFSLGRIIALLLLVAIAVPPATWGWVWWTARQDQRPASDAIVVLGASQYNGVPSPIFEARLHHAADLYQAGAAPAIVTVGGNQPGDNFTEGGAGRDWLIAHGVPAESVVAVEKGSNTLRSVEAAEEVFQGNGWSSTIIVTDPWHSLRSRIMAEDAGIEEAATSPVRSGPAVIERETQLWYITRETGSLWYYWIFGDSDEAREDFGDTDAA